MEQVLWHYALPYDERRPVICFDERPCFLIGDTLTPLPPEPGRVKREHYEYQKNGSCALLVAIEPLTGKRIGRVFSRRTKAEYTAFMQSISAEWQSAEQITLIQDNLNTHTAGSFYERLTAATAFDLAQRLDFVYTPKGASWLNMVEIELSAIARACLHQRIPTIDLMQRHIKAVLAQRNALAIKINWQFTVACARDRMSRHYEAVRLNTLEAEC